MGAKKKNKAGIAPRRRKPARPKRTAIDRRERFAREYVVDLNATAAAIRAGYSPKTAQPQASRLLSNAMVAARVEQLKAEIAAKYNLTVERTVKQIARIAYGDPRILYDSNGNMKPVHELSEDAAALLAGIETEQIFEGKGKEREYVGDLVKVKVRSAERALALAMSYLGMNKSAGAQSEGGLVLSIRCSDGKAVR
jgi:phage terminase small subunit